MSLASALRTGELNRLPSRRDEDWRWTDLRALIRASVDHAGDFHLTYEIKSAFDPVIRTLEVKTIQDIEATLARLLVQYEDVD